MRDDELRNHLARQREQTKRTADAQVAASKAQSDAARAQAQLADLQAEQLEREDLARAREERNAKLLADAEVNFRTGEALMPEDLVGAYVHVGLAEVLVGGIRVEHVPAAQRGQHGVIVAQAPILKARVARALDPEDLALVTAYVEGVRAELREMTDPQRAHELQVAHRNPESIPVISAYANLSEIAATVARCLQTIDPVAEMPSSADAWREHLHRVVDAVSRLPDTAPGDGFAHATKYSFAAAERDCVLAARGDAPFPRSGGADDFPPMLPTAIAVVVTAVASLAADTLSGPSDGMFAFMLAAPASAFFALHATRAQHAARWARAVVCRQVREALLREQDALVIAVAMSVAHDARKRNESNSDLMERAEALLGARDQKARELGIRLSMEDSATKIPAAMAKGIVAAAKELALPLPPLSAKARAVLDNPVDPGFIGLSDPFARVGAVAFVATGIYAYAAEYFRLDADGGQPIVMCLGGGAWAGFFLAHRQPLGLRLLWIVWGAVLSVAVFGGLAHFTFRSVHAPLSRPAVAAAADSAGATPAVAAASVASAGPSAAPVMTRPPGLQRVFRCAPALGTLATVVLDAFSRESLGVPNGLRVFRTEDEYCLGVTSRILEHERRPLASALGVEDRDPLPDSAFVGSFRRVSVHQWTPVRRNAGDTRGLVAQLPQYTIVIAFRGTIDGTSSASGHGTYVFASDTVAGWVGDRQVFDVAGCRPGPSELYRLSGNEGTPATFVYGFGNVRVGGRREHAAWLIEPDEAGQSTRLGMFVVAPDCTATRTYGFQIDGRIADMQLVDAQASAGPTLVVIGVHGGPVEEPTGREWWVIREWHSTTSLFDRVIATGAAAGRDGRTDIETGVSSPYGYFPVRLRPPTGPDEYLSWSNGSLTSTFVERQ